MRGCRVAFAVCVTLCAVAASAQFTPKIATPSSIALSATYGNSSLYEISAPGYVHPILLLNVRAMTRYDVG